MPQTPSAPPKFSSGTRLLTGSLLLFLDRGVRMAAGFGAGIVLARCYGPQGYGEISYLIALTAIFGSLASFGLDELLPRDLAAGVSRLRSGDIVITGIAVRALTEALAYLALTTTLLVGDFTTETRTLGSLLGLYYLFQATDVIEFFLRVERQFRAIVAVRMISSLVSGALKVLLALEGLPLITIIGAMLLEFGLSTAFYLYIHGRWGREHSARFVPAYARSLLIKGLPLVLSGGLMMLQVRMDALLIEPAFGSAILGQYSAALRLTELVDIVAIVLSIILIPELGRGQGAVFERLSQSAYLAGGFLFMAFLPILGLMSHFFEAIYGPQYPEGPALIPWLAIRPFFYMVSVIRVARLVAEGRLTLIPLYPALTVLLTFFCFDPLTERYGLQGAAMAGSLAVLISSLTLDLLFNRANLWSLLRSPSAFPVLWRTMSKALSRTR